MTIKVELVWHDVKEKLPEIKKHGTSVSVIISIHDTDVPPEDADEWEKDFYTPFFASRGYLHKLTTGCAVWLYCGDNTIVEEHDCYVSHWAEEPDPVVVEGAETK